MKTTTKFQKKQQCLRLSIIIVMTILMFYGTVKATAPGFTVKYACVGDTVWFYASNLPWKWTFGDPASGVNDTMTSVISSGATSNSVAYHVYSAPGNYLVRQECYGYFGQYGYSIKNITIGIDCFKADFSYTNENKNNDFYVNQINCDPLMYYFADKSVGDVDSVIWNFDDPGSGLNNQQKYNFSYPTQHQFTSAGNYDVSLIIYKGNQTDTSVQQVVVSNSAFGLNLEFSPHEQFPPIYCSDDTIIFKADICTNSNIISYSFDPGVGANVFYGIVVDTVLPYIPNGFKWSYNGAPTGYYFATLVAFDGTNHDTSSAWVYLSQGPCNDVWPGDADHDGIANAYDIFPIGYHYNRTGVIRTNSSNSWVGQYCSDWNSYNEFLNTNYTYFNQKHTDCNGNGTIEATDILPIILNYGQTHNKKGEDELASANAPELYLQFVSDSVLAGKRAKAKVMLGNNLNPASNIYGAVFSLQYDTTLVYADSITVNYTNSWLGNSTTLLHLEKNFPLDQYIDIGVVRNNQIAISGYGEIAEVGFTMKDDISGKSNTLLAKAFQPTLYASKLMEIAFGAIKYEIPSIIFDSIVVYQNATSITSNTSTSGINIYPNPVKDILTVDLQSIDAKEVSLISVMGQKVYEYAGAMQSQLKINTSELPYGMYYLTIKTNDDVIVKPVVK